MASLLFMAVPSAFASDLDDLTAASDNAYKVIVAAIDSSDGTLLMNILSSDAAVVSPTGSTIEGRLTIVTGATLFLKTIGAGEVSFERLTLNIIDDVGYETGRFHVREKLDNDQERTFMGRFTAIWIKEDGAWKLHRALGIR